ncbi:hypothetical protein DYB32_001320 [Aphanomyces invadans]|uniref:Acetyl-coenzyme A synthetase N-terminal domain-containing protein n=1 Tax=Aphanomyces invadans TaxID=157072 RepID=A0A3R6VSF1_9STRA|nr:hypothetical protein DYB32_001320 [Aphanomyces invadans]
MAMLGRRVSLLRRLVRISSVQRSAFLSTKKNYFEEYDKSLADPEAFWADAAKDIHWFKPYTTVLDQSNSPFNKWFVDGEMNTCYSAVDEHVANGRGDQVAIHYDSPMTNTKIDITYKELQDKGKPVGTPDAGAFWRVVSEYNVRSMFTAPTALRAIRKEDPNALQVEKYASKMNNLRYCAHDFSSPMASAQCLKLDGRECPGIKLGSASRPVPGFDVVLHNHDEPTEDPNEVKEGSILLRLPLPPGSRRLLELLTTCPAVQVGVADTLKGQVPIALVVLKSNAGESNEHVSAAIVTRVRQEIGAFVCLRHVVVVDHLPKTRSGKIVRRTIQTMADNKPFAIPATIENEAVLDDILVALQSIGYAKHPHHHLEPHQHVANT